jgi:hypothetical protein
VIKPNERLSTWNVPMVRANVLTYKNVTCDWTLQQFALHIWEYAPKRLPRLGNLTTPFEIDILQLTASRILPARDPLVESIMLELPISLVYSFSLFFVTTKLFTAV